MTKIRLIASVSCVVFCSVLSVFSQKFHGKVTFSDGTACTNAKVTIYNNFRTVSKQSDKTDNFGNYDITLSDLSSKVLVNAYAIVDKASEKINFYFTLTEPSPVQISYCDLLGNQTLTVYSKTCASGQHSFVWDYSPYKALVDNKISLLNFATSQNSFSQKIVQGGKYRVDFYDEYNSLCDMDDAEGSGFSYTAVVEGDGFGTHFVRHLLANGSDHDFVVNKDVWVPFKCNGAYFGQYNGTRYEPFYVKGINLGAAIPGTSPAEMAPTAEQYAKWFGMMGEAGYNLIRVYTLHYPRFYVELKKYNEAHPNKPLYLMHGAWLDEEYEGFETSPDLYNNHIIYYPSVMEPQPASKNITDYFDDRIKEVINVVHGNASLVERWGWASGKYTADVSPWLVGYIVGREIYANEVVVTNKNNPSKTAYQGGVFSLSNGSPTEVWATQRLDKAMAYELSQYAQQHPVSFSSWPSLDPIDHPTENSPEDMVAVNLDGIDESNSKAGYFASYHVYPYFPDFMVCDPSYRAYSDEMGEDSYLGYLTDLKSHYPNRPLIISEFGVPSSWGTSRFSTNGMHHGGLTETQQGDYLARMMANIKDADCGGGIQFSWIDEWFKYVWLFAQTTDPTTRNRWHNIYNAEQNYGLIAFVPEEPNYSNLKTFGSSDKIGAVSMASDVEGIYVKIKLKEKLGDSDTLWVAIDTYDSSLGESVLPNSTTTTNRAEFCAAINKNISKLYVTKAYDMYGIGNYGYPKAGQYFVSIPTDGAGWNLVRWKNHRDANFCAGSVFTAGLLNVRNPDAPSRHDAVIFGDNDVQIKLPWGILNFNDPSQLKVAHVANYSLNGINYNQTKESDGVALTVSYGNSKVSTTRYKWSPWTEYSMPKTVEYRKTGYYIVKKALKGFSSYLDE